MFIFLSTLQRLHGLDRPVLALTGGIGTGKSTVAEYLAQAGFPVISADGLVKKIYAKAESVQFIQNSFPHCIVEGKIHFPTLRKHVFSDPTHKAVVENFIY